jgi:hypothetical protein
MILRLIFLSLVISIFVNNRVPSGVVDFSSVFPGFFRSGDLTNLGAQGVLKGLGDCHSETVKLLERAEKDLPGLFRMCFFRHGSRTLKKAAIFRLPHSFQAHSLVETRCPKHPASLVVVLETGGSPSLSPDCLPSETSLLSSPL